MCLSTLCISPCTLLTCALHHSETVSTTVDGTCKRLMSELREDNLYQSLVTAKLDDRLSLIQHQFRVLF
jgi:hypothetical protein